jgi:hypothetical protein
VRNRFLVNFWNRTIVLWTHCMLELVQFWAMKLLHTSIERNMFCTILSCENMTCVLRDAETCHSVELLSSVVVFQNMFCVSCSSVYSLEVNNVSIVLFWCSTFLIYI